MTNLITSQEDNHIREHDWSRIRELIKIAIIATRCSEKDFEKWKKSFKSSTFRYDKDVKQSPYFQASLRLYVEQNSLTVKLRLHISPSGANGGAYYQLYDSSFQIDDCILHLNQEAKVEFKRSTEILDRSLNWFIEFSPYFKDEEITIQETYFPKGNDIPFDCKFEKKYYFTLNRDCRVKYFTLKT